MPKVNSYRLTEIERASELRRRRWARLAKGCAVVVGLAAVTAVGQWAARALGM